MNDVSYENELTFDLPIKFKKNIEDLEFIELFPVKMEDYMLFQLCSNIITKNKNKTPSVEIIKMSYLDYIFYLMNDIDDVKMRELYSYMFYNILRLVFKKDDIQYIKENNKYSLKIDDFIIDGENFDAIKDIIIAQNLPDYDDTYIDPKVEEVLLEAERFVNRHKKKMGSLEDQIICVLISTNLKMDDIAQLSLRKFSKILQRVDYKLHYEIYKSASLSGMVSFENEIDHWMTEIKHERFSGVVVDSDNLTDKLKHVT